MDAERDRYMPPPHKLKYHERIQIPVWWIWGHTGDHIGVHREHEPVQVLKVKKGDHSPDMPLTKWKTNGIRLIMESVVVQQPIISQIILAIFHLPWRDCDVRSRHAAVRRPDS